MSAGFNPPAPDLPARYQEPHRRHHTLEHVRACLAELDQVKGLDGRERKALEHAIWWHDAVYDPQRTDNERLSADLARAQLETLGERPAVVAEVVRLIELTAAHRVAAGDRPGALFVSIDLSVLGRSRADYDRYAANVREEYAFVPDAKYRSERAAVLKKLLKRRPIYPDPGFARRYEAQARANLARELAALEAQAGDAG